MSIFTTNNNNFAQHALDVALEKKRQEQCTIVEVLVLIQISINSLAEQEARNLCRVLIDSKNKDKMEYHGMSYDYGAFGVRRDAQLIIQDLDKYNKQLIKTVKRASTIKIENSLNRDDVRLVSDMSDTMDISDELLEKHLTAIKDYLKRKTPKGTEFCPKDPWMLQQLMLVDILTGIASNVHKRNKILEPALQESSLFDFMDFNIVHNRIERIRERINLRNKYDKPLRFNYLAVLRNAELIGSEDKYGRIDNGILCHLRDTLYSTNFIDYLFYKRDGIDYERRKVSASIVEGLRGDKSINFEDEKDIHSVCA